MSEITLKEQKRLKTAEKSVSTSFWVQAAQESWSKYTTAYSPFLSSLVWIAQCLIVLNFIGLNFGIFKLFICLPSIMYFIDLKKNYLSY